MEQACADNVSSERMVDSDSLASERTPIMEQACTDNVLGKRTVDSDSRASENIRIMEQECAGNVPSERTVEYGGVTFESIPIMVNEYAENLRERYVRHYCLASGDIPRLEVNPREINHDHYRFAYQLVEKVLKIRGELNPNVPHNLPEPSHYFFTEEHESIVEGYLGGDPATLIRKIQVLSNGNYNTFNYLKTRNVFVKEWGDRVITEKSFIAACASIAFVAAYFIRMNYHCGALDDIVVYIARWFGTIDRSSWRRN